jgi:hypothetical protein
MKKIALLTNCFLCLISYAQLPTFQWAKQMGGNSPDYGQSIAVDASGNVYTTGAFEGAVDFDPGSGSTILNATGGSQVFVTKFDSNGNFVWAKNMGPSAGSLSAYGMSIKLDALNNVYTTGYFQGTADFDPGVGVFNLTTAGFSDDVFISKLDSSGNFRWAKQIGGSSYESGLSISLDSLGYIYTSGFFEGTVDFDPGAGIFNLTPVGPHDSFISKLDTSGNFVWAKSIETTGGYSNIWSLATDATGNLFVTGTFQGTADFDPNGGVFNFASAGSDDIFISKLDSSGNMIWANRIGGSLSDWGTSILMEAFADLYISGRFSGAVDFNPGTGVSVLTSAGGEDAYIAKFDTSGNFIWARSVGGASNDASQSITSDQVGNIYSTGRFESTADFDPNSGIANITATGFQDIFVLELDSAGNFVWVKNIGGTAYNGGNSIVVDFLNNIYTTGYFSGTTDFNTDAGTMNLTSAGGSYDIYVHKMNQVPLGINQYSHSDNIVVYPNPSSGHFSIGYKLSESEKARFIIYDVTGRTIFESTLKCGDQVESIADLKLANGVYPYKIISSENTILEQSKLIIVR